MANKEIPVQNIYYLLCYAWDALEESDLVDVKDLDTHDVVNLLAKILISGTQHLIKKGLDRTYAPLANEIPRIRGKLLLAESIKRCSFENGKAVCSFDEFNPNNLHNQILKSTIGYLLSVQGIKKKHHDELKGLYQALPEISEVRLASNIFRKVRLHRNNRYYLFLLKVCEFLFSNILVGEEKGISRFRDFIRDEAQMRLLFEKFVRQFYVKHCPNFYVHADRFHWHAESSTEEASKRLPALQTDICLTSNTEKIIIDTKYSVNALAGGRFEEKLNTTHLYQLFSYMMNVPERDYQKRRTGILLYPTIDQTLNLSYKIHGHRVLIRSVNLAQEWPIIEKELLAIIDEQTIEQVAA